MSEGDGNTKYFHASVKANRGRKSLDKLVDENRCVQRAEALKGEVAAAYFTKLFTSSNPDNFQEIIHDFQPKVSEEMNQQLIRQVTKEEIKDSVFSVKASKTLGVDGMT